MPSTPIDLDALAAALDQDDGRERFLDLRDGSLLTQEAGAPPPGSLEKYEIDAERFIALPRLALEERLALREAFTHSVEDPALHLLLVHALGNRRALRSFDYELEQQPAMRDRWQRYRQAQLREWVGHWLQENGFEPTRSRF